MQLPTSQNCSSGNFLSQVRLDLRDTISVKKNSSLTYCEIEGEKI